MDRLLIFVFEILICLGISLALIVLLKPLLRELLTQVCGTQVGADFWVMFTLLMQVIAPLLIVVYFAPAEIDTHIHLANELRQALFWTLLGDFIALSAIGLVIWRTILSGYYETTPQTDEQRR